MFFTRKKRQSKRRLRSQFEDFDQDFIIGNAISDSQGNVIRENTVDQEFRVNVSRSNFATKENLWHVKILGTCVY